MINLIDHSNKHWICQRASFLYVFVTK